MKSKNLLAVLILAGTVFNVSAQNVSSTSLLTSGGYQAGTAGNNSVFYGAEAGKVNQTYGQGNVFVGAKAGINNQNGGYNVFMGYMCGAANTEGQSNTIVGNRAGELNTTGQYNVFIGSNAGKNNTTGASNIHIGLAAGSGNSVGSKNVFIGQNSGCSYGSGNVMIGYDAGPSYTSTANNELFIHNSSTATPLIWGNFIDNQLKLNGKVAIGGLTTFPVTSGSADISAYQLFVKGGILTEAVRVSLQSDWADYVFQENYNLPTLNEVENYIKDNKHLPNMPSAAQIEKDGIDLAEITTKQQEKIEELTLYIIQQQKEIEELKAQMKQFINQK